MSEEDREALRALWERLAKSVRHPSILPHAVIVPLSAAAFLEDVKRLLKIAVVWPLACNNRTWSISSGPPLRES
jgi:hypothetical protein